MSNPAFDLAGKCAVVIGGTSGLGKSIALGLAAAGADTDRGREQRTRTPMGRFGGQDEVAGAAIYFASNAASFVTGTVLAVDGEYMASGVNQ